MTPVLCSDLVFFELRPARLNRLAPARSRCPRSRSGRATSEEGIMRNVAAVNRWVGLAGLALCVCPAGGAVAAGLVVPAPSLGTGRCDRAQPRAAARAAALRGAPRGRRRAGARPLRLLSVGAPDRPGHARRVDGPPRALLVADSDLAEVVVDGEDGVCVSLFGHVYDFANKVALDLGGTPARDCDRDRGAAAGCFARWLRSSGWPGREGRRGRRRICR